jgi:hypothetical protein
MSSIEAFLRLTQVVEDVLREEEEVLSIVVSTFKRFKSPSFFRERWNSEYLRNLAICEGSFVDEYRLDPGGFDHLLQLLMPSLSVNEVLASNAMGTSGSGPISEASRLGAALIMLGGGRRIEAMRTHGVSSSFAYHNLHRVCKAIVNCKELIIEYDISIPVLEAKAQRYKERSSYGLFEYCVDSIDGIKIMKYIIWFVSYYFPLIKV